MTALFRLMVTTLKFIMRNRRRLNDLQVRSIPDRLVLSFDEPSSRDVSLGERETLLALIEQDIDTFWRTVPFHTVFLNYSMPVSYSAHGGTCSDRAVMFFEQLQDRYGSGLNARLHRASINGRKTHTVILAEIDSQDYLIDVGGNWPVMRLIPCFEPVDFCAFGIRFRSRIERMILRIEMKRPDQEHYHPFIETDLTPQPRKQVMHAIDSRYDARKDLPFANGLRFACVHGNSFYTLRENTLSEDTEYRKNKWIEYRNSAESKAD